MFTFLDFRIVVISAFGYPFFRRNFSKFVWVYCGLFELWRKEVSSLCTFEDCTMYDDVEGMPTAVPDYE